MPSPQILIVGAGPSGLVLALTLLKNGVPVRLIEKDAQFHRGERGPGIMPRTLEIEHFLGVGDDVKAIAKRGPIFHVHDPKDPHKIIKSVKITEELDPSPAFPEIRLLTLGQWRHQAVLHKAIEALGGKVELGTALTALQQDGDKIIVQLTKSADEQTVTEEAEFAYVVGADGGHSAVRKSLGINFVGQTREEGIMFIVDCVVEGIDGTNDLLLWGDATDVFGTLRHTGFGQEFQIIFSGPNVDYATLEAERSPEALQNEFRRITGRSDIIVKEITNWQGEWRANIRMAEKFQVGRAFIIGDAAHTHSPTGGQGMNSSIQDAFNLGWKLAVASKGHASPGLLASYEVERMPVISTMLQITTELFERIFNVETQRKLAAARAAAEAGAGAAMAREQGWFRDRKLFQLDINYRWSAVVLDERFPGGESTRVAYGEPDQDVRAGDRAPDAPVRLDGAATRLFDIFGPMHHTVLLFGGAETGVLDILHALPPGFVKVLAIQAPGEAFAHNGDVILVEDSDVHARKGYGLNEQSGPIAVAVRPDGMIGAFATSAKGLEQYFSFVFVRA
ncbi:ubiquinone biosynthesis hydroxylase [Phanerochaete sordida]|uniref:Ubiquinone biosynthesis hydroxylase n=1 Tax=Phanerochaete sordida TaxID=48140 RepID=A0A9P3G0Q6_9APHY|nr:ubiquinone biosynthesis hydroxylase [Phanerochaete sordida]